MTPVTFDGCFGWLHAPQGGSGSNVGVIICTGILQDALLAYGSLRALADDLAAAGYATLRFDYPGTGDSCDDAAEKDGHWTAWRRSLDQAANWLRAISGAERLVLVGLRLGTTLAALAASQRDDVAALLLFEPVVSGRNYVRQLTLEAEMLSGVRPTKGENLYLREFRFAPATLDQFTQVDLRKIAVKTGTHVALCAQNESKATEDAATAWRSGGAEVATLPWTGLDPLVRHKVIDEDVLADFTAVLSWLRERVPVAPSSTKVALGEAALLPPGCIETPVRFGPEQRLFGMLCRPHDGKAQTVILLGNAGHDPHYASARHAVTLARKLAARGIASLRLDYAGLGDSVGPPGKERMLSHVFAVDRGPDVSAAVDALQAMGYRRFGIEGLCSGAFHAFRTALTEPRINTLLVVNLPFFTLPGGSVLGYLEQKDRSPIEYIGKLFRPRTWATLLSGKVDYAGIFVGQLGRLRARAKSKLLALARRTGLLSEQSFAKQAMAALTRRGTTTLFLFSPGEEAEGAFALEFGPTGAGLAAYGSATMHVIQGMDHHLTAAPGRVAAEALMVDYFAKT
jgi:alpha-beta hydrolase superfamily lysophospholipase